MFGQSCSKNTLSVPIHSEENHLITNTMSHVYWIMIRTLNWRCSSGGSGGKLSCSCCGCLCCEVEGLPHGNWIFRKNYRERTSSQDARMVALMLPVHSCAAVFLLTWILAKCMKRISFPWTRLLGKPPMSLLIHFRCLGIHVQKTRYLCRSILRKTIW